MTQEKVIMFDSPEAAQIKTITGWVGGGRFWGEDERMARWSGSTHNTCECGKIMEKSYTKCRECIHKSNVERYNALPLREWDGNEPVCTWDGEKYFFSEDDLICYMEYQDEPVDRIELLICEPNEWSQIDTDYWSDMMPEDSDGDLPDEMQKALDNLNAIIAKQKPQSYSPGKIRTEYKRAAQ